ncbi:hypothetical protein ACN28S_03135 [Cystobacter fuscus]
MRAGRGVGVVVLALALGACRSRNAGPADAPPPANDLSCERLVAPEVRDALPGFTLQQSRPCPTCGPLCTLRSAEQKDVTVSIAYDCRKHFEGEDVQALLSPTLRAGGTEIPAMGRAAARREPVPGMLQVSAWDDDTPCGIIVTWLGADKERAIDIARATLFATTPERLAAAHPAPSTPDTLPLEASPADAGTP